MTNSSVKKLLSVDRHAMQDLHAVIGFDFNKPFTVWEISGRFTVKQIEKEAEKRGYNNAVIAVCVRDRYGWNKDFSLATVRGGVVTIDYKTPYYGNGRGLDTFYAKCSFEDMRKRESAEAVIFAQSRDDIKKPKEKKVDFSERFKVERVNYCTDGHGARWISRLDLKQTTNNEKQLAELRRMIQARKMAVVEMLKKANTSEELKAVEKAVAYWKGLAGIVSDFERFEKRTTNKEYRSIAESNLAYNAIKAALVEG